MNENRTGASGFLRGLDRVGGWATLLLPVFLVHFRGIAEGILDGLAIGFLMRSAVCRDWRWIRSYFVWPVFLWWGWIVLCSVPRAWPVMPDDVDAMIQALVALRFPVAAFALAFWTLQDPRTRSRVRWIVTACVVYIGVQLLWQAVTGSNFFGTPRFGDGTLTGPYDKPRAAAPFSRLALPVALWAGACLALRARQRWVRATAFAMTLLPVLALLVLAGQRMALATFLLGVGVAAVLLPKLRYQALAVLALTPLFVTTIMVAAPGAFGHLVLKTEGQLRHFAGSDYGLIYNRALMMAQDHPLTGLGYDAYRHHCRDTVFQKAGTFAPVPDGGGERICVQHAHNHWLEAVSNGGVPGLVGFGLMIIAWGWALLAPLRGCAPLVTDPAERAWQAGLFAAFVMQEWPLASSSAFLNMPLGGVAFLLLGLGLCPVARNVLSSRATRA